MQNAVLKMIAGYLKKNKKQQTNNYIYFSSLISSMFNTSCEE